ncbi:MAG: SDR family oxidoreductase [Caulobacterales bacterium]
MTSLANKVALITGAGRGIGKAIAERYGRLGADIVVNYASDDKSASETVEAIRAMGARAIAVRADVSRPDSLEGLFQAALHEFNQLDIVVANAGIELINQAIADFTEEEFDRLFAVNTKGAFFTLQKAAKYVVDNGRIIYIGSSTTSYPLPGTALYGGSKMAPRFLIEVLAKEIGHRGVAVNSIIPTAIEGAGVFSGGVDPAFREFVRTFRPMERMGTMNDVADVAEFLAGPLAGFISGQHLLISGGAPS